MRARPGQLSHGEQLRADRPVPNDGRPIVLPLGFGQEFLPELQRLLEFPAHVEIDGQPVEDRKGRTASRPAARTTRVLANRSSSILETGNLRGDQPVGQHDLQRELLLGLLLRGSRATSSNPPRARSSTSLAAKTWLA